MEPEECIICYDTDSAATGPLLPNNHCECRYVYHEQCIARWRGPNDFMCVICRFTVSRKPTAIEIVRRYRNACIHYSLIVIVVTINTIALIVVLYNLLFRV